MDDDIIKFLEALSCIFTLILCYLCYICKKTREHTPLLDLETNIETNVETNIENRFKINNLSKFEDTNFISLENNSFRIRRSFLDTIPEEIEEIL